MINDIVTRLRERADERMEASEDYWQGHKFEYDIPYIENQAADEIERLRDVVTTWIICAERLVESNEDEDYKKALAFYLDCQRIANETCR